MYVTNGIKCATLKCYRCFHDNADPHFVQKEYVIGICAWHCPHIPRVSLCLAACMTSFPIGTRLKVYFALCLLARARTLLACLRVRSRSLRLPVCLWISLVCLVVGLQSIFVLCEGASIVRPQRLLIALVFVPPLETCISRTDRSGRLAAGRAYDGACLDSECDEAFECLVTLVLALGNLDSIAWYLHVRCVHTHSWTNLETQKARKTRLTCVQLHSNRTHPALMILTFLRQLHRSQKAPLASVQWQLRQTQHGEDRVVRPKVWRQPPLVDPRACAQQHSQKPSHGLHTAHRTSHSKNLSWSASSCNVYSSLS